MPAVCASVREHPVSVSDADTAPPRAESAAHPPPAEFPVSPVATGTGLTGAPWEKAQGSFLLRFFYYLPTYILSYKVDSRSSKGRKEMHAVDTNVSNGPQEEAWAGRESKVKGASNDYWQHKRCPLPNIVNAFVKSEPPIILAILQNYQSCGSQLD